MSCAFDGDEVEEETVVVVLLPEVDDVVAAQAEVVGVQPDG